MLGPGVLVVELREDGGRGGARRRGRASGLPRRGRRQVGVRPVVAVGAVVAVRRRRGRGRHTWVTGRARGRGEAAAGGGGGRRRGGGGRIVRRHRAGRVTRVARHQTCELN